MIDIVIPWVDGNDPAWQKEFYQYNPNAHKDDSNSSIRYRDWNNLQFLFRGIEKYMPWVRKVHFVTNGQKPLWLNINAPKLNFVVHKDFIPEENLPVFSIRPIELNLHRIPGISDKFLYFNDDFFVLKPMKETDFFRKGLPVDIAALNVLNTTSSRCLVMANNIRIINDNFCLKSVIKSNAGKWLNPCYGSFLLKTLFLMKWKHFPGIQDTHLPQPFLKDTFYEVWNKCKKTLEETSSHRFREISDVNVSLMRYWQIASGNIVSYNVFNYRKYFEVNDTNIGQVCDSIIKPRRSLLILNDSDKIADFEKTKEMICSSFEELFPNKSSFEL